MVMKGAYLSRCQVEIVADNLHSESNMARDLQYDIVRTVHYRAAAKHPCEPTPATIAAPMELGLRSPVVEMILYGGAIGRPKILENGAILIVECQ